MISFDFYFKNNTRFIVSKTGSSSVDNSFWSLRFEGDVILPSIISIGWEDEVRNGTWSSLSIDAAIIEITLSTRSKII